MPVPAPAGHHPGTWAAAGKPQARRGSRAVGMSEVNSGPCGRDGGLGFCLRISTITLHSLRNGWSRRGHLDLSAPELFWEAVFLPQPDQDCLSRLLLATGTPWRLHGRREKEPAKTAATGSTLPGSGAGQTQPWSILPRHTQLPDRTGDGTPGHGAREVGLEMNGANLTPSPPPAAPRAHSPPSRGTT